MTIACNTFLYKGLESAMNEEREEGGHTSKINVSGEHGSQGQTERYEEDFLLSVTVVHLCSAVLTSLYNV